MSRRKANTVGGLIRRKRIAAGLSQFQLGRAIGLSQTWVWQVEHDEYIPLLSRCRTIAAALDLSERDVAKLDRLVAHAAPIRRGSPEWKAKVAPHGWQPGHQGGHQFKKGNIPWCQGKYVRLSPATEFKKGCLRGRAARRYHGIGQVTVRRDKTRRKRRWIKVREHGPPQHHYIPLARYFWKRDHGPLPPGKFVVHRNGDTMDDRPANLMLMDFPHLLAFQRTIRPNMEAKRRARNALAQQRRWTAYYRMKAFRAAFIAQLMARRKTGGAA